MGIFNKNKINDEEKEVSTGSVIGWALLGFAVIVVIAFLIFCIFK